MPVWYETVMDNTGGAHVYLSPACISRTVFDNRLEDLLHSHSPKNCKYIDGGSETAFTLCSACTLFGRIGGKGEKSLGSSLRFGDALLEGDRNTASLGIKTLQILSGPKTSSVEFSTKIHFMDIVHASNTQMA
ncbi:MAG: hypothetical protein LBU32_21560 [Clostridiales bacterium]|jgi:hypothetical protein|nr:hypothetical protein [Clostridiales bacterium]